jgi:hypothetical protein
MKLIGASFAIGLLVGTLITLNSLFFHDLLSYLLFCISPTWYFFMKHHYLEEKILVDIFLCTVFLALLLLIRKIKMKRGMDK